MARQLGLVPCVLTTYGDSQSHQNRCLLTCWYRIVQSQPVSTVQSFAARWSMVEAEAAHLSMGVQPGLQSVTCRQSWAQAHSPGICCPGFNHQDYLSQMKALCPQGSPGSALLLGLLSLLASCRLTSMWMCVTIPLVHGLRPRWSRYRREPCLRKSPVAPVPL